MRNAIKIGRLFGIEIDIDWSWLFIFFLVVWDLGTALGRLHPDWSGSLAWGTAVIAALLFFGSVLLHELAHSLVAKSQGIPVRSITLYLFGGVSNIQREPPTPRAEFLITIVGPLTSLILGAVLTWLAGVSAGLIDTMTASARVLARLDALTTILMWLGSVNLLLGLFNLIPAFPLDGGRILRSILWAITGKLRQATRWASRVGQVIAWVFIVAGIMMVFGDDIPFLGTGVINGLWLAFIGWFLNSAAAQSYQQVVVQDLLHGIPVSRLMRSNPPTVSSTIPVSGLVQDYIMGTDDRAFPVVDDDRLVGLVTVADVRNAPRRAWDTKLVRDVMTPADQLVMTTPEEGADEAWNRLMSRDVQQLPVVRGNQLVGVLRRRDISQWLHLQSDMKQPTMRSAEV